MMKTMNILLRVWLAISLVLTLVASVSDDVAADSAQPQRMQVLSAPLPYAASAHYLVPESGLAQTLRKPRSITATKLSDVPAARTATQTFTCDAPARVMPLGNSITYGTYGSSVDTRPPELITGYRQPLYLNLVDAGYYVDFVGEFQNGQEASPSFDPDHQGVPGIKADEVADQVYDWLEVNPTDVVLLHIGTNDIAFSDPVMQVVADVTFLLDEIDRYEADSGTHVTVVLARIINRTGNKTKQENTTLYNEKLQEMADERVANGDDIIVVDHESALDYSTDLADTLHPNDDGYAKMATVWQEQALETILPVCPLAITKSAAQKALYGSPVTFTIGVSNTTNTVDVTDVAVSDPLLPACDRTLGSLTAGASTSYTCTMSNVTEDVTNTVSVTGMVDEMPPVTVTETDSVFVDVIQPAISVTLTSSETAITAGQSVSYTYDVTNIGDDSLDDIQVDDNTCAPVSDPSVLRGDTDTHLDPGEIWTYTCSFTPAGSVTSVATASGNHSLGGTVSGTDSVFVEVTSFQYLPLIRR